jgi:hypothetical protein
MDPAERLRLDYDQTSELVRALMDVRFKLLAFVPTIAGAAVALVGTGKPTGAELLGVGILGLLATFGVLIYELRNTQVYNATVNHARALERLLGLGAGSRHTGPGDLLAQDPPASARAFGLASLGRERAVAIVYGAALAGWSYLVAWGALRAAGAGGARSIAGVIGAVAGLLVLVEVDRISRALAIEPVGPPSDADGVIWRPPAPESTGTVPPD